MPLCNVFDGEHFIRVPRQGYLPFIALLRRSAYLVTDSGGVQEEAPSLGKPVLVMRQTTERPEGLDAGVSQLVGANRQRIVDTASRLLKYVASAASNGSLVLTSE